MHQSTEFQSQDLGRAVQAVDAAACQMRVEVFQTLCEVHETLMIIRHQRALLYNRLEAQRVVIEHDAQEA